MALENAPAFPTYPRRMNATETVSRILRIKIERLLILYLAPFLSQGAGLVLPYAAQTILGTGGAGAGDNDSLIAWARS